MGTHTYMHVHAFTSKMYASTHDTCTHVFVYVQYMQIGFAHPDFTYLLTDTTTPQVAALKVLSYNEGCEIHVPKSATKLSAILIKIIIT